MHRSASRVLASRVKMWIIRPAHPDDAEAACAAVRASIEQLCQIDHDDDPAVLAAWLANKQPDTVRAWIESNPGGVFVACQADAIGGAAAILPDGHIVLNYVAPWARFQGVTRALLQAMEHRARTLDLPSCHLSSTVTAHRFYLAHGYTDDGPPTSSSFGSKPCYPMRRALSPG